MAKGKNGSNSTGKTSAGINSNVSKSITKEIRKDYLNSSARVLNQLSAHQAGKRVVLTIENPIKTETNKKFIRVLAKNIWKDPKYMTN